MICVNIDIVHDTKKWHKMNCVFRNEMKITERKKNGNDYVVAMCLSYYKDVEMMQMIGIVVRTIIFVYIKPIITA